MDIIIDEKIGYEDDHLQLSGSYKGSLYGSVKPSPLKENSKIKEDRGKIMLDQNEKNMIQKKSEDDILKYLMEMRTPTKEEKFIMSMSTLSRKSLYIPNKRSGEEFRDEKNKTMMLQIFERIEKSSHQIDVPKTDKNTDSDLLKKENNRIRETERIKEIKTSKLKQREKIKEKELEKLREYYKDNKDMEYRKTNLNLLMKNSQKNLLFMHTQLKPVTPQNPQKFIRPNLPSMTIVSLNRPGTRNTLANLSKLKNEPLQITQKSPIEIKRPSIGVSNNNNDKDKIKGRKQKLHNQLSIIEVKPLQKHKIQNSLEIEEFKFQMDESIFGEDDGFSLEEYLKYQSLNGDSNNNFKDEAI